MEISELEKWCERADLIMSEVFNDLKSGECFDLSQITGTLRTHTHHYDCIFDQRITVMIEGKRVLFEADLSEVAFHKMLIAILRNELISGRSRKSDPEPQPTLIFVSPSQMQPSPREEIRHKDNDIH